jgi:hypothetical protein
MGIDRTEAYHAGDECTQDDVPAAKPRPGW